MLMFWLKRWNFQPKAAPVKEAPKKRGRVSAKRGREDEDETEAAGATDKAVRMYKDEPIPEEQPILLTGGIMRDYQVWKLYFTTSML